MNPILQHCSDNFSAGFGWVEMGGKCLDNNSNHAKVIFGKFQIEVESFDNEVELSNNDVELFDNDVEPFDNVVDSFYNEVELSDNEVELSDNDVELSDNDVEKRIYQVMISDFSAKIPYYQQFIGSNTNKN